MTDLPQWAHKELSASLPSIRSVGEDTWHEFKVEFPSQARDLAKEIAAFATSGGGDIFIGVDDNGDLVGVVSTTAMQRDALAERAHGIALSMKPVPKVEVLFAVEDEKAVLVLRVHREQEEPVYYYENRPYVRDLRRSRPAEPVEVKELVWTHPSSEFKRAKERLALESMTRFSKQMADQTERASRQSHETRQKFIDRG